MSRRRRWALVVAGGLLISSCSVGPSRRPDLVTLDGQQGPAASSAAVPSVRPTGPGGPGRTAAAVQWADCPSSVDRSDPTSGTTFDLDCAQVSVPTSYTAARPQYLSLAIARARKSGVPASAPVLFVALDDPDEYGVAAVAAAAGSLPAEILDHYAIVVMDPRGTGGSAQVDCVSPGTANDLLALSADPSAGAGSDEIAQLTRELTFDCGDEAGPDLSSFASVPAADDIDTVRAALGTDTISYLGRGFGATLGAIYVDRYPGRVAAMVLDGPADPLQAADKRALAVAAAQEKSLAAFAAACPTFRGGCPLGDDPAGRITTLVGRLGDTGIGSDRQVVTGGTVLLTLMLLLDQPSTWPDLAAALAALDQQQDAAALTTLLSGQLGGDDVESRLAADVIYACNDMSTRLTGTQLTSAAAAAKKVAPTFGAFALGLVGLCGGWPVPDQTVGAVTGAGAPPILVLGATDDPTAPLAAVQSLVGQLASAELVRWQSEGHGTYPTGSCVTKLVDAYLLHSTVPAADTLCPP